DSLLEDAGHGVVGNSRDGERKQVEIERVAMVVRRSLAVAAVRDDLAIDLVDQDSAAERFTTIARTKLRQHAAGDIERQRFAERMPVRAEVVREIALDMSELAVDSQQDVDRPGGGVVERRLDEELERPDPGQRAKPELEHARPIDAREGRILMQPVFQLRQALASISLDAGQPECATERQPVLAPIALPDHLVISALRSEARPVSPE